MSRRRQADRREILPDAKFGDTVVTKFMNNLMHDGKKSVATRVVYDALDQIKKRMPDADPINVFTEALNNVKWPVTADGAEIGRVT